MPTPLGLAGIVGLSGIGPAAGAGAAAPAISTVPGVGAAAGTTFTEALQSAARTTVSDLRNAEQISLQALQGDADIRDVADAVMSAEQNLQAAISIRDKIVSAYLEISRMQI